LTRIPSRRWSAAIARVNDCTAPLLAEYRARWGRPAVAAMEHVLTIAACDERRRYGRAARVVRTVPSTVEDAVPLLVGVVLDGTDGADARVVDEDVQATEPFGGLRHGRAYRGVVAEVGLDGDQRLGGDGGVEVEDGHRGAVLGEHPGRGQPDAGRAAGDDCLQA
jgi:hypothetical protein